MFDDDELECDCLLTVEEIQEGNDGENQNSSVDDDGVLGPSRSSLKGGGLITLQCLVKNILSQSSVDPSSDHHPSLDKIEIKQTSAQDGNNRHRYECSICRKSFKASDTLKEHRRVKHEHVVYGCPSCRITLRSKSGFRRHIRQCHANTLTFEHSLPVRRRRNRVVNEQDHNLSETTSPVLDDRNYVRRLCSKVALSDLVDSYSVESNGIHERKISLMVPQSAKPVRTTRWTNSQAIDDVNDCRREAIADIKLSSSNDDKLRIGVNTVVRVGEETQMSGLRCEQCLRMFVYHKSLINHLRKHADGTFNVVKSRADVYTCYFCRDEFGSERLVADHMSAVHRDVACAMCGVLCHGENELNEHVRSQHRTRLEERNSWTDLK